MGCPHNSDRLQLRSRSVPPRVGLGVSLTRSWRTGFGPYPTSAFPVINKYNKYRNITPTSITMFPLSILRNLTGLYLGNTQYFSGTLVVAAHLDYS